MPLHGFRIRSYLCLEGSHTRLPPSAIHTPIAPIHSYSPALSGREGALWDGFRHLNFGTAFKTPAVFRQPASRGLWVWEGGAQKLQQAD